MPDDYKQLAQVVLDGTYDDAEEIYTAPAAAGSQVIIKHIRVVNNNNEAIGVKMYHGDTTVDPDGLGDPDSQLILPGADIAAGGWAEFEGTIILDASDAIWAARVHASTGAPVGNPFLTVTLYGLEMTP